MTYNPVHHDRIKHVEVDRFFIKEKLEEKTLELPEIQSEDQLTNILTKVVSNLVLSTFLSKLGICDTYAPTWGGVLTLAVIKGLYSCRDWITLIKGLYS